MKKFESIAIISAMKMLADGSWKLSFDCNELTADQLKDFGDVKNIAGKLYFATPDVRIEPDVKDVPTDTNEKSPSERLRSRMFVYYRERNVDTSGFREWYSKQLDKIGQNYLDKLN